MSEQLTHWRKLRNPKYIASWDFAPGEEKTVTIASVQSDEVFSGPNKKDFCIVISFREPGVKPMISNVKNSTRITALAGTHFVEKWVGLRVILWVEQEKIKGEMVDSVRVKPVKPGKPVLDPSGPAFDKAAEFVRGGGDVEKIRAKYEVSAEVITALNNVAK